MGETSVMELSLNVVMSLLLSLLSWVLLISLIFLLKWREPLPWALARFVVILLMRVWKLPLVISTPICSKLLDEEEISSEVSSESQIFCSFRFCS